MRSMAVRPNSFSRFRCCAGVSSSSNTTVSASRVRLSAAISSALPRPTNVAGSGASRRCRTRPTTSAPALSTNWASSSSSSSTSSVVKPGKTTPTRMMRSRNARSMSVPGSTLLKRASRGGCRCPPPCARVRPGACSLPRRPPRRPRGCRRDCAPGSLRRPPRPSSRAAAAAATLPVPQASVSPTPRSQTLKSSTSPSRSSLSEIHSTLMPPENAACSLGPSSAMSTLAVSGPSSTRCGLPTSTVRTRRSSNSWGWSGPRRAGPMSTLARAQPGSGPGVYSTVRRPQGGHGEARRGHQGGVHGGLGQATYAVAAHFGLAAVGVVQLHGEVAPVAARTHPDDAVGPDAASAVGQQADLGHRQPDGVLRVEDDQEVVPGPLVLGGPHPSIVAASPVRPCMSSTSATRCWAS